MDKNSNSSSQDYDPQQVARFFDGYGMREWDRLVDNPVNEVSLYIHNYYLEEFLSPGMRVLEIGAGAGRFTQTLARLGVNLVVADISPGQLDLNREHARHYNFETAVESWLELDACDMSALQDQSFEAVVAYGGVFSYTLDRRNEALLECMRVLKPGGLLLLSVIALWGSAHRHLDQVLNIPVEVNRRIIKHGDILPELIPDRGQYIHMFRSGELRAWLEGTGLRILAMSASDCLSTGWYETLEEIRSDEEKWSELLGMELEVCAEPGSWNMGMHTIAVTQKS
jgi:2-polyprenyl-3-methyl-5-hydroxy-6-metoxy-1,4-benzoquinol methylase